MGLRRGGGGAGTLASWSRREGRGADMVVVWWGGLERCARMGGKLLRLCGACGGGAWSVCWRGKIGSTRVSRSSIETSLQGVAR